MASYLLQLIGLREMHSSVALAQLGRTLFMAAIRVWRLEEPPLPKSVPPGREYEGLSLHLQNARCGLSGQGFSRSLWNVKLLAEAMMLPNIS